MERRLRLLIWLSIWHYMDTEFWLSTSILKPACRLFSVISQKLHVGPNETLYGAIRYDQHRRPLAEIVRGTYIPDLHVIPGNLELWSLSTILRKPFYSRQSGDTLFFARIGQALAQAQNLYDVVVIDCPPQLGYLTLSALTAATAVLITIHPQMLDVMSMSQFLQMTGDLLDEVSRHGASS